MDAAVVAAIIAAGAGVAAFAVGRYVEFLERRRRLASEALSAALLWLEIPYRVRRRTDDSTVTRADLAQRIHDLHERHIFHKSWLQVEIPKAHAPYEALVNAVKRQAGEHIQGAWRSHPIERPEDMNVGLLFEADVSSEIEDYVQAVRSAVGFFGFLPWQR